MLTQKLQALDLSFLRSRHGTRWRVWDFWVGWFAFFLGFLLSPHTEMMPRQYYMVIVGSVHGVLLLLASRFCGVPTPEQRSNGYELITSTVVAMLLAYVVFSLVVWAVLVRVYGRYIVLTMEAVSFIGLVGPRWLLMKLLKLNPVNVVIYGAGEAGRALHARIREHGEFQVTAFLDEDAGLHGTTVDDRPVLGGICTVGSEGLQAEQTGLVVVCVGQSLQRDAAAALLRLPLQGIEILNKGAFVEQYFKEISVEYDNPQWFVSARSLPGNPSIFAAKRLLDVSAGLAGLLLSAPLWPLIALAVKLDSRGPVFFGQERVGWRGELFRILKFRTMTTDAEKHGAQWATQNDPRVTRLGRFLRRTRLDELPQLWNIVKGDMSLVGPRPERPEFVKELAEEIPFYEQRHLAPPGLTGWAQIRYQYGSSKEDALRKLEYDLYYVRHLSLAFDIEIILRTIPMMMKGSR